MSIVVVSIVSPYQHITAHGTYVQVDVAQYCLYNFLMTLKPNQAANKQL